MKIKELLKEKYEWIFCIDGDLLIYKFYKDIFDYVDKSKSLIMCSDGVADTLYNFNSGAMLFKNTEFSKKFIDDITPLIGIPNGKKIDKRGLYFLLHNYEIFLRGLIKKSGLEMAFKPDAKLALGRR